MKSVLQRVFPGDEVSGARLVKNNSLRRANGEEKFIYLLTESEKMEHDSTIELLSSGT